MAEENNKEENRNISSSKFVEKLRGNPYIASTIVLGIFTLILLYFSFQGGISGSAVSSSEIGSKAVDFINSAILQGQGTVTLDSVNEKNGMYEVLVDFQGKTIPTYFTKDGLYYLGTQIAPLTAVVTQNTNTNTQTRPTEVTKSDKPIVELFVMTYCPYGTQAEKGLIPAIKALGDKTDAKIRFVHYFMHGDKEEKETYNQVCIREEQNSKYMDYLSCFLGDSNSERCLDKTGMDKTKLNSCLSSKAKEYYKQDSELSQQYGVQGSPTLIINGIEASSARNSAAFLSVICSAFNSVPGECSQKLSSEDPTPGFGAVTDTAGHASTDTQCA